MEQRMNIYALVGHKVKVTEESINSGYGNDIYIVQQLLKINKEYTVDHTEVNGWSTGVYLKEFPDIRFNSVSFVDVKKQPKRLDKKHHDWSRYND